MRGDAAMIVNLEGFALGSDGYAWDLRDGMEFESADGYHAFVWLWCQVLRVSEGGDAGQGIAQVGYQGQRLHLGMVH